MKVILLQDIKALGKKGELVEASDGYARNYLLPKKLAKEANAQAMNEYKNAENSINKEIMLINFLCYEIIKMKKGGCI